MSLTPAQMQAKMIEHFGFEAADNVDGVLSTLTPDVVHDIIGWPAGPSHGHAEARRFYEILFADLEEGSTETLRRLYGDHFMVDESRWTGRAVGRPFGIEGRNRTISFRMLHVLEFSEAGQISREQVWLDMAAIIQQLTAA